MSIFEGNLHILPPAVMLISEVLGLLNWNLFIWLPRPQKCTLWHHYYYYSSNRSRGAGTPKSQGVLSLESSCMRARCLWPRAKNSRFCIRFWVIFIAVSGAYSPHNDVTWSCIVTSYFSTQTAHTVSHSRTHYKIRYNFCNSFLLFFIPHIQQC